MFKFNLLLHLFFIINVSLVLIHSAVPNGLPEEIQKCHRDDHDCIIDQSNDFLRKHMHGYPALGIPDIEPFVMDKVAIAGDRNSSANINLELTNTKLHGYASNLTITKMSGFTKDPSKVKIDVDIFNSYTILRAKYKISGKILILPIVGDGDIEIIITNLKGKCHLKPSFEVINNKTYLTSPKFKILVTTDRLKTTKMTNLFNGDKTLGDSMLSILNKEWKLLWDEMSPKFNEVLAVAHEKIFLGLFKSVSYDDLFLPDD